MSHSFSKASTKLEQCSVTVAMEIFPMPTPNAPPHPTPSITNWNIFLAKLLKHYFLIGDTYFSRQHIIKHRTCMLQCSFNFTFFYHKNIKHFCNSGKIPIKPWDSDTVIWSEYIYIQGYCTSNNFSSFPHLTNPRTYWFGDLEKKTKCTSLLQYYTLTETPA